MFLKGGLYLPVSSEFAKSLSSLDTQVTLERKDKPSEVQRVGRSIDDICCADLWEVDALMPDNGQH